MKKAFTPRLSSLLTAFAGIACVVAIALFGSCRKPSLENNNGSEQESPLKKRIEGFYSQMKELHTGPHSNAKTTTAYMSLDSAEFLIETTYNYEVARINDSLQTEYHGFSFDVPVTNDSLLSETEVSDYMYRIKDSMMVAWDSISFESKSLSLFDLEIDHASGNANATFTVHYTITSGEAILWEPNSVQIIYGDATGWSVLNPQCGASNYTYQPPYTGVSNAYFKGVGVLNYITNSISGVDCSQPGAALVLRAYGINNYFATYGLPPRTYLPINIKLDWAILGNNITTNDYISRGYSCYGNLDQYWIGVNDNGHGHPDFSGTGFYAQWLNPAMMNFYLGYIPSRVNNHVPLGKYFYDLQITMAKAIVANPWVYTHYYDIYYSDMTDLALNENPNSTLPHF